MKIRCDVCDKKEASLFCCADEAALCDGCDRRVHHANKLASKHMRFSLVSPSIKESPLCDICQEKRALLFCQEDRAILCRECDLAIHKANEYTKKHNRFLLTGVKLSASSSLYPSSSSSDCCDASVTANDENGISHSPVMKTGSVSDETFSCSYSMPSATREVDDNHTSDKGSVSTSSISEYLMETLPGWRVEDLLDPSSAANVFCKTSDQFLSFGDQDLETNLANFSSLDSAIRVPEVSSKSPEVPLYCPQNGFISGFKESTAASSLKAGRKRSDGGLAVPQISPPSLKKTRYRY